MFADALLTGVVLQRSLQNSPLESSCVVVALVENYSTYKTFKCCTANQKVTGSIPAGVIGIFH